MEQPASSSYRQVRLTYTEEAGGRCSYRIHAKPYGAQWSEKHLIASDGVKDAEYCRSVDDVYARLILILSEMTLP